MLIQYIAQQKNPWVIASRQAVPVIQIIWDHLFADIPQEIMTTSAIYHLVCIFWMYQIINFLYRLCNTSWICGIVQSGQLQS